MTRLIFLSVSLYRRLLRAHRRLPPEMRSLGDEYVKAGNEYARTLLTLLAHISRISPSS